MFSTRKQNFGNQVNSLKASIFRTATPLLPDHVHREQVLIPALFPLRDWLLLQLLPSPGPFLPGAARCVAASPSVPPVGPWYQKFFLRTGKMFLSTSQSTYVKNHSVSSENWGYLQNLQTLG